MVGARAPAPWPMAKKYEMACPRSSNGKISETVRYAADAPAEAKKNDTHQKMTCVVAVKEPEENRNAETANTTPAMPYVPKIIFRRPTVSNSGPRISGPARLPSANGKK